MGPTGSFDTADSGWALKWSGRITSAILGTQVFLADAGVSTLMPLNSPPGGPNNANRYVFCATHTATCLGIFVAAKALVGDANVVIMRNGAAAAGPFAATPAAGGKITVDFADITFDPGDDVGVLVVFPLGVTGSIDLTVTVEFLGPIGATGPTGPTATGPTGPAGTASGATGPTGPAGIEGTVAGLLKFSGAVGIDTGGGGGGDILQTYLSDYGTGGFPGARPANRYPIGVAARTLNLFVNLIIRGSALLLPPGESVTVEVLVNGFPPSPFIFVTYTAAELVVGDNVKSASSGAVAVNPGDIIDVLVTTTGFNVGRFGTAFDVSATLVVA